MSHKKIINPLRHFINIDKHGKNNSLLSVGDRVYTPKGLGVVHEIDGKAINVLIYGKQIWFDEKDITKGEGNVR